MLRSIMGSEGIMGDSIRGQGGIVSSGSQGISSPPPPPPDDKGFDFIAFDPKGPSGSKLQLLFGEGSLQKDAALDPSASDLSRVLRTGLRFFEALGEEALNGDD